MAEFPDSVGLGAGTSSMLENGDAVGLPGYALGQFTCAFCDQEVDDLKTHVESVHSNDIFKFLCGECAPIDFTTRETGLRGSKGGQTY